MSRHGTRWQGGTLSPPSRVSRNSSTVPARRIAPDSGGRTLSGSNRAGSSHCSPRQVALPARGCGGSATHAGRHVGRCRSMCRPNWIRAPFQRRRVFAQRCTRLARQTEDARDALQSRSAASPEIE
ncbi:hypothetical protein MRX96_037001 [Rhipicephalus microplus]